MIPLSGRQPNLLPPRPRRSRTFFVGVAAVFVFASVFLVGDFPGKARQTASITDQLSSATPTPQETQTPRPRDTILSSSTATVLARGIYRDTVRWFDEQTGQAYEGNLRTRAVRELSDAPDGRFLTGIWVPGMEQAFIVSENARSGRVYRLHDYHTGSTSALESDISVLAVSPDGLRIAYVVPGPDASFLVKTARADGTDAAVVFRTRLGISALAWQNAERLLLAAWKPATTQTDLIALTLDGVVTAIYTGKENLEFTVSERGSVLVSHYTAATGLVTMIYPATSTAVPTVPSVSARKCGWAPNDQTLLCGIPDDPAAGRGSSLTASHDSLVVIDAEIGLGSSVALHENNRVSIFTPVISSSGSRAAFIDLFDRRVHVVEL